METRETMYFDPFADEGAELFNPIESFTRLRDAYSEGKNTHDYSADKFVSDTEALMLDAVFVERFDAVQAIAMQMHQMCGEDHGLRSQIGASFLLNQSDTHTENDGHGHSPADTHNHDDDDETSIFGLKKKKKKKK